MEQFHTKQVTPFKATCGEAHSLYKKIKDQSLKKAGSWQTYGWCLRDLSENF